MDVYWVEQSERDVPSTDDWLGPHERAHLGRLHIPKRRSEWRLGRWTAKRAIAAYRKLSLNASALANIEIRPEPSGAPQVFVSGKLEGVAISISHSAGTAICTLGDGRIRLGCDLEIIEPRADAFLRDYFTQEEQELVYQEPPADRPRLITLLWSGKESALKALKHGLRVDTRSITVQPELQTYNCWTRFDVRSVWGDSFHGWSREAIGLWRTVVADFPCSEPVLLQIEHPSTSDVSPTADDQQCSYVV